MLKFFLKHLPAFNYLLFITFCGYAFVWLAGVETYSIVLKIARIMFGILSIVGILSWILFIIDGLADIIEANIARFKQDYSRAIFQINSTGLLWSLAGKEFAGVILVGAVIQYIIVSDSYNKLEIYSVINAFLICAFAYTASKLFTVLIYRVCKPIFVKFIETKFYSTATVNYFGNLMTSPNGIVSSTIQYLYKYSSESKLNFEQSISVWDASKKQISLDHSTFLYKNKFNDKLHFGSSWLNELIVENLLIFAKNKSPLLFCIKDLKPVMHSYTELEKVKFEAIRLKGSIEAVVGNNKIVEVVVRYSAYLVTD